AEVCADCRAGLPWNRLACPGCARPQTHDAPCGACATRPPPYDAAWTAFVLETPVQQGIHGLKYRGRLLEAARLGRLIAPRLPSRPDLIIPVPLHRWRLMRRGYNQASELARWLTRLSGIPSDLQIARRTRATPDQIGKTAAERRRNLKDAFHIGRDLGGLHVALLDDVMTTGATLAELARACREAGALRVEAWAAARTA
ncbi:MAG: ComF family protein, partial [Solimonas sp.]